MKSNKALMRSTAVAAFVSLTLVGGGVHAQDQQQDEQSQQAQETQSSDSQGEQGQDQDRVVATVGDVKIMGSDLATVIGTLPPQLQSQSPDMLVPLAMQQLIVRELILEEALSHDLAQDPEVVALVEAETQSAQDDALIQVWLEREMANVVTDEAVQRAYDEAKAQGDQDLAPLEQVRPQIEQYLRQQAMQDIQTRLRQGADIVFYDPAGRPLEPNQQDEDAQASSDADDSESGEGQNAGSTDGAGSSEDDASN